MTITGEWKFFMKIWIECLQAKLKLLQYVVHAECIYKLMLC